MTDAMKGVPGHETVNYRFFAKRSVAHHNVLGHCDSPMTHRRFIPFASEKDHEDMAQGSPDWNTLAVCAITRALNYARNAGCTRRRLEIGSGANAADGADVSHEDHVSKDSPSRKDTRLLNDHPNSKPKKAPVIPFIVSMTNCGEDPFMEGAAVLKYSIHLTSIHGPMGGRYDYKMYALYHPDATDCAKQLEDLGYELVRRQTPVKVEEIEGAWLRSRIEKNGCCGAKELIKLEAYTFTQYPVVVHLDMDVIIRKPLDILFDVMLDESGDLSKYSNQLQVQWPNKALPTKVNALLTRDCKTLRLFLEDDATLLISIQL